MKCIYCNEENELTVSDIIPSALTNAKITRKFVCKKHNAFTNDNYEKRTIERFGIYRNLIGLTERDGDPVRFIADLQIDGYTFKNTSISNKASILNGKRCFSTKEESGTKIIVGDRNELLKIKGATTEKIKDINIGNVEISRIDDIRELFVSNEALHVMAKIAYEWHCFHNEIELFDDKCYADIVNYILFPDSVLPIVSIVNDGNLIYAFDSLSRTGTSYIFEYNDYDGFCYVIFGLWNVITYKIKICKTKECDNASKGTISVSLFHVDGTAKDTVLGMISIAGEAIHINSVSPQEGISMLSSIIKKRLSSLGERDLSKEYLQIKYASLSKMANKYYENQIGLEELLDYENEDNVFSLYILDILTDNIHSFDASKTFNENMVNILQTDGRIVFTKEKKNEILTHYNDMHNSGTLSTKLMQIISTLKPLLSKD